MEEFITQAAERFGVSGDRIRSLTGGLLGKLKSEGDEEDFSALAAQVPGVAEVTADSEPEESGGGFGGGMLGGLLGKAADAVGAGGAADVMGLFEKSGLSMDQASGFAQSLFGFLEEKAGAGLMERLLSRIPMLKNLLG